jgi:hypothetical protein
MADVFGVDIDKLISKKDKAIVRSENDLLGNFDNIEKKVFDAVKKKINTMNIESGKILFDDTNTEIVNEIDSVIQNALQVSNYPSQVKDFLRSFETIKEFNFDAQKSVNDISEKELSDLINPIQKANVEQTLDGLTGTGVSTNFIQPVREGIYKNIVAGTTISDLETYLSNYILSNPERMSGLKRYVTQVSRDSLNQFDGQVNSKIAETFGLDAFRYVGSLIDDSRPQCVRWVGKNVLLLDELQSELNWAYNNGTGMIPGTTPNNFAVFRGGYNCRHSAIPFKLTKSQRAELGIQQAEQQVETNQKTDLQIKELKGGESIDTQLAKIEKQKSNIQSVNESQFFTKQDKKTVDAMNEVLSNNDGVVGIINQNNVLVGLRTPSQSTTIGGAKSKSIDGSEIPVGRTIANISNGSNGNCSNNNPIGRNSFMNIKIEKGKKIEFKKIDMNIDDQIVIDKTLTNKNINYIEYKGRQIVLDQNNVLIAEKIKGKWKNFSVRSASIMNNDENIAATITHESAHLLQNFHDLDLKKFNELRLKKNILLSDSPTIYGESNPKEFWTESFTSYVYDNKNLKQNHPKVFKFVESYLNEMGVDLKTIKLAE